MTKILEGIRADLIKRWEAIPDAPPADAVDKLAEESCRLVHLIGWIDENPGVTQKEYMSYAAFVKSNGTPAQDIRVIP